jgi:MFS family permease
MSVTLPTELSSIWITGGLATFMGTLALASCPTLLANAVSAERQGRVMGNNQALQVGAESLSAVIGGALAGMFIPLPLIAFGLLLIAAGFIARIDASIAFRCSRKSIKLRAEPNQPLRALAEPKGAGSNLVSRCTQARRGELECPQGK